MITASQATVAAYIGDGGGFYHARAECIGFENVHEAELLMEESRVSDGYGGYVTDTLEEALEDLGFDAIIQYTMDEYTSTMANEELDQQDWPDLVGLAVDMDIDLTDLIDDKAHLIERIIEAGYEYHETCDGCLKEIGG